MSRVPNSRPHRVSSSKDQGIGARSVRARDERARSIVSSAVLAELRAALEQADVRASVAAGEVTGTDSAAVVVGLSLGEAALLAQALRSSAGG